MEKIPSSFLSKTSQNCCLGIITTIALAMLCCALPLLAFYPGFMSFDSGLTFWLARHGEGFGMTPQILTLTWRALLAIHSDNGGALFLLNNILFWSALTIFALSAFRTWYARALMFLICGVLSPCTMILAHLWSDALLLGALSLACALLFLSAVKQRALWAWLALPLLIFAGLTRFNALPALLPLFAFWFLQVANQWITNAGKKSLSKTVIAMLISTIALTTATWGITLALEKRFATIAMSPWPIIALWDLVAVSVESNEMVVPVFARKPEATLESFRMAFRPYSNIPILSQVRDTGYPGNIPALRQVDGTPFAPYTHLERQQINEALLQAITKHPMAYLKHRWRLTQLLFGSYQDISGMAFSPGMFRYEDNPPVALSDTEFQKTAIAGYWAVIKSGGYAPIYYLGLSLLLIIMHGMRRKEVVNYFSLVLLLSGLFYVAPLPFIAPSAEMRYSSWLFFSTLMAALLLFSSRPATGNNDVARCVVGYV